MVAAGLLVVGERVSRMDAAERTAALARVRPWVLVCAAFLHLDHWTVTLDDEPSVEGATASCRRMRGQMDATIFLSDHFFTMTERERREVLCHELLHAHLRPLWEVWADLDEVLGKPAYVMLRNHAEVAEEQVVEALARVLAPLLPAPPGEE